MQKEHEPHPAQEHKVTVSKDGSAPSEKAHIREAEADRRDVDDHEHVQQDLAAKEKAAEAAEPKVKRLVSLDAYRGFVMLAMVSGGFGFATVYANNASLRVSPAWRFLAHQFEHVMWTGCVFWDLIQPSFMFIVGVAMPFSLAARRAKGQGSLRIYSHAAWRALLLVALGVFLASNWSDRTNFLFTNVLAQIGLGYVFVLLLVGRGWVVQSLALAAILLGYWYLFYQFPAPPAVFDYTSVSFRFAENADWQPLDGFFAHWNPGTNAATEFDLWLGQFLPRNDEFNAGGYQTLNFIPSMATMLLGVMAGELLRGPRESSDKIARLILTGIFCLILGWGAGELVCPVVKRIWTPPWAVFSAGWCFLLLAVFYLVIDVGGWWRWSMPLVVVGMNSIAIYLMAQLSKGFVRDSLRTHLYWLEPWFKGTFNARVGEHVFDWKYGPIIESSLILLVLWLVCLWLYRRRIFLRI